MTHLHPSQIDHYSRVNLAANATSWGLLFAIIGLLSAGTLTRPPALRSLLFGLAWGVGIATGQVRKIAIETERVGDDLQDISLTAFQQWAYESMRPSAAPVPIDAEIVTASDDALDVPVLDPSEASKAHHTIIAGPTGAGKSELVKWLVGRYFQGSRVRVYDCDAAPHDWQGLEVIGRRGDFIGISGAMLEDLQLLDRRCNLLGKGQEVGGEEVRICEELPTVAAELTEMIEPDDEDRKSRPRRKVSIAANWLKRIARRGRKYRIKLILITQETSVAAMGIEGEGSIRQAFTIFYLGNAALEQAEKLRGKDKPLAVALLDYLRRCDRPCLVDHKGRFYVVNIPELTASPQQFQPAPAIAPRKPETNIRNQLEMLYQQGSTSLDAAAETVSDTPKDAPKIAPERAKRVGEMKAAGLSQTQILAIEWGVKPGDSQRYRDALQQYRAIVGEV